MKSICIQNITRHFSHICAADNISLNFEGVHAITGESGVGKSTLLRIIAGFEQSERGSISVGTRKIFDFNAGINIPPEKRNFGYIFQDHALFPHLSVEDNIAYGLRHATTQTRREIRARVGNMLNLVHLEPYAKQYPAQLSGGQAQRVAIARALATEPDALLMDEPFSSLDRELKQHLVQEMIQIIHSLNIPSIFVSHDPQEVFELADRLSIMKQGRILQTDSPKSIYEAPKDCYTASFFGEANFLHVAGGTGRLILIRPENIKTLPIQAQATKHEEAGTFVVSGQVLEQKYRGNSSLYWVECEDIPGFVSRYLQVSSKLKLSEGDRLKMLLNPQYFIEIEQ